MLETAIAAVGEADVRRRARLLAALALELTFGDPGRRRLSISDEALRLAQSVRDPEVLARVLLARYVTILVPGLVAERFANTAELVRTVEAVPDPAVAAQAHLLRGRAALEYGDVDEADRSLDVADRLSAGLGQPALRWSVLYTRTGRAILAGRFHEAECLLAEARDAGRAAAQAESDWVFAVQRCALRLYEGRVDDEVIDAVDAVRHQADPALNDSVLAVAACELDRDDEAAAALARFATASEPFDLYWLPAMMNWAAVAARLGNHGAAQRLEKAIAAYADQAVPLAPVPTPSVRHHLGMLATALGRYDDAEAHFARALTIHERLGAAPYVAQTRLECAHMLLARDEPGDAERARDLLAQALATARELGLANIERRAVALLH